MTKTILLASVALVIAGCSSSNNPAPTPANESAAAPVPTQHFDTKEGEVYIYQSALSEDDKNAGKATPNLVGFKYLGEDAGVHTLQLLDPQDDPMGKASCSNPCKFIKMTVNGTTQRMAYSEDSLIGSAFQDAFNGLLEPIVAKKPQ